MSDDRDRVPAGLSHREPYKKHLMHLANVQEKKALDAIQKSFDRDAADQCNRHDTEVLQLRRKLKQLKQEQTKNQEEKDAAAGGAESEVGDSRRGSIYGSKAGTMTPRTKASSGSENDDDDQDTYMSDLSKPMYMLKQGKQTGTMKPMAKKFQDAANAVRTAALIEEAILHLKHAHMVKDCSILPSEDDFLAMIQGRPPNKDKDADKDSLGTRRGSRAGSLHDSKRSSVASIAPRTSVSEVKRKMAVQKSIDMHPLEDKYLKRWKAKAGVFKSRLVKAGDADGKPSTQAQQERQEQKNKDDLTVESLSDDAQDLDTVDSSVAGPPVAGKYAKARPITGLVSEIQHSSIQEDPSSAEASQHHLPKLADDYVQSEKSRQEMINKEEAKIHQSQHKQMTEASAELEKLKDELDLQHIPSHPSQRRQGHPAGSLDNEHLPPAPIQEKRSHPSHHKTQESTEMPPIQDNRKGSHDKEHDASSKQDRKHSLSKNEKGSSDPNSHHKHERSQSLGHSKHERTPSLSGHKHTPSISHHGQRHTFGSFSTHSKDHAHGSGSGGHISEKQKADDEIIGRYAQMISRALREQDPTYVPAGVGPLASVSKDSTGGVPGASTKRAQRRRIMQLEDMLKTLPNWENRPPGGLTAKEVLACRYLRLSTNNVEDCENAIRDMGEEVNIHSHMSQLEVEARYKAIEDLRELDRLKGLGIFDCSGISVDERNEDVDAGKKEEKQGSSKTGSVKEHKGSIQAGVSKEHKDHKDHHKDHKDHHKDHKDHHKDHKDHKEHHKDEKRGSVIATAGVHKEHKVEEKRGNVAKDVAKEHKEHKCEIPASVKPSSVKEQKEEKTGSVKPMTYKELKEGKTTADIKDQQKEENPMSSVQAEAMKELKALKEQEEKEKAESSKPAVAKVPKQEKRGSIKTGGGKQQKKKK